MAKKIFNRQEYERGVVLFSTLLVQIGVTAETVMVETNSSDHQADTLITRIDSYLDNLSDDDLAAVSKMLDVLDDGPLAYLKQATALNAINRLFGTFGG